MADKRINIQLILSALNRTGFAFDDLKRDLRNLDDLQKEFNKHEGDTGKQLELINKALKENKSASDAVIKDLEKRKRLSEDTVTRLKEHQKALKDLELAEKAAAFKKDELPEVRAKRIQEANKKVEESFKALSSSIGYANKRDRDRWAETLSNLGKYKAQLDVLRSAGRALSNQQINRQKDEEKHIKEVNKALREKRIELGKLLEEEKRLEKITAENEEAERRRQLALAEVRSRKSSTQLGIDDLDNQRAALARIQARNQKEDDEKQAKRQAALLAKQRSINAEKLRMHRQHEAAVKKALARQERLETAAAARREGIDQSIRGDVIGPSSRRNAQRERELAKSKRLAEESSRLGKKALEDIKEQTAALQRFDFVDDKVRKAQVKRLDDSIEGYKQKWAFGIEQIKLLDQISEDARKDNIEDMARFRRQANEFNNQIKKTSDLRQQAKDAEARGESSRLIKAQLDIDKVEALAKAEALHAELTTLFRHIESNIDLDSAEAIAQWELIKNSGIFDAINIPIETHINYVDQLKVEAQKKLLGKPVRFEVKPEMSSAQFAFAAIVQSALRMRDATGEAGAKIAAFDNIIRGLLSLAITLFLEPIIAAVIALGVALTALAASAIAAGAALGGALVAGISQAIPVVGLLAAAANRIKGVFEAVSQANLQQQQDSYGGTKAANRQAAALDGVKSAQEGVANAQRNVIKQQEALTKAREEARKKLEDLILTERGASISAEEAQNALRDAIATGEGGALAVASRQLAVDTTSRTVTTTRREITQRKTGGIEKAPEVVQAAEQLQNAERAAVSADRALKQAKASATDSAAGTTAAAGKLNFLLKNMSDSERKLFETTKKLQDTFKDFSKKVTEPIILAFDGVLRHVDEMLGDASFIGVFKLLAEDLGAAFTDLFDAITSPEAINNWMTFIQDFRENLPIITDLLKNFGEFWANIGIIAQPALKEILSWLNDIGEKWKQFAKSEEGRNYLGELFDIGVTALKSWVDLLGSISRLFLAITMPGGGAQAGINLLELMTGAITNLSKAIEDPSSKANEFLHRLWEITHVVVETLVPAIARIGMVLLEAFEHDGIDSTKNFVVVIDRVLIPAFKWFIFWLGLFLDALSIIVDIPLVGWLTATTIGAIAFYTVLSRMGTLFGPIHKGFVKLTELMGKRFRMEMAHTGYSFIETLRIWRTAFRQGFTAIAGVVRTARDRILSLFTGNRATQVGSNLATDIVGGFRGTINRLREGIKRIFGSIFSRQVSHTTGDITGQVIGEGMVTGVNRKSGRIRETVRKIFRRAGSTGGSVAGEAAGGTILGTFIASLAARLKAVPGVVALIAAFRFFFLKIAAPAALAYLVYDSFKNVLTDLFNDKGPSFVNTLFGPLLGSVVDKLTGGGGPGSWWGKVKRGWLARALGFGEEVDSAISDLQKKLDKGLPGTLGPTAKPPGLLDSPPGTKGRKPARGKPAKPDTSVEDAQNFLYAFDTETIKISDKITKKLGSFWQKLRTTTRRSMNLIVGYIRDLKLDGGSYIDRFVTLALKDFSRLRVGADNRLRKNSDSFVNVVKGAMQEAAMAVYDGVKYMNNAMRDSLAVFGGEKVVSISIKKPGITKAEGGWIGQPGERGKDKVPTWLGRGEAVLNWGHQKLVEPALNAVYGFGLQGLFNRTDGYHAGGASQPGFAAGGFTGPGQSGEGFTPVWNLARNKFGMTNFTGYLGHKKQTSSGNISDHFMHRALDMSNGILTRQEDALSNFFKSKMPQVVKQLIWRDQDQFTGAQIGGHRDHVHLAMFDKFAFNGKLMAKLISRAARNLSISELLANIGVGGDGINADFVDRVLVKGKGALKNLSQKVLDRIREGINNYIGDKTLTNADGVEVPNTHYEGKLNKTFSKNSGAVIAFDQAVALAQRAGFPAQTAQLFGHIAVSESGLRPGVVNSIGATGLWQIYNHPDLVRKYGNMRNPWNNARAAYELWQQSGTKPWVSSQAGWGQFAAKGGFPQQFANGGIVDGSIGAAVPIVAHAGEWVLNKIQQSRLATLAGTSVSALKKALGFTGGPTHFANGGEVKKLNFSDFSYTQPNIIPRQFTKIAQQIDLAYKTLKALSTKKFENETEKFISTIKIIAGDSGLLQRFSETISYKFDKAKLRLGLASVGLKKVGNNLEKMTGKAFKIAIEPANIAKEEEKIQAALTRRLKALRRRLVKAYEAISSEIEKLGPLDFDKKTEKIDDQIASLQKQGTTAAEKNKIKELRKEKSRIDKRKENYELLVGQLRDTEKTIDEIDQEIIDSETTRAELQRTAFQESLAAVTKRFDRQETVANSQKVIGELLGDSALTNKANEKLLEVAKNRKIVLQQRLDHAIAQSANNPKFEEVIDDIRDQITETNQTIIDRTAQILQESIAAITNEFDRSEFKRSIAGRRAELLAKTGGARAATDARLNISRGRVSSLEQQRNQLTGIRDQELLKPVNEQNKKIIEELTQKLADLDTTIQEEIQIQKEIRAEARAAAREASNAAFDLKEFTSGLIDRGADLQEKTGDRAGAFATRLNNSGFRINDVVGIREQAERDLADVESERSIFGVTEDNTKEMVELQKIIAENTIVEKELRETHHELIIAYRNAQGELIRDRAARGTGLIGQASTIFQNIAQLLDDEAIPQQISATNAQRVVLTDEHGSIVSNVSGAIAGDEFDRIDGADSLLGQLLAQFQTGDPASFATLLQSLGPTIAALESTMGDADKTSFRAIIDSMVDNTIQLQENSLALKSLNETLNAPDAQSWASTAWQMFRLPIFTGTGSLLPQYQSPQQMHTGGVVTKSGIFELELGERVVPANMRGTEQNINLNIDEADTVVDPVALGNKIAFTLKHAQ